jgi:hypothetical protein
VVVDDEAEEPECEVLDFESVDDVGVLPAAVPEGVPVVVDPAAPATAERQPKPTMLTAQSRRAAARRACGCRRACGRPWGWRRHGWWAAGSPACSSATRKTIVLGPPVEKGFLLVNMAFL